MEESAGAASFLGKGTGTVCAKHPEGRCTANGTCPRPRCQELLPHPNLRGVLTLYSIVSKLESIRCLEHVRAKARWETSLKLRVILPVEGGFRCFLYYRKRGDADDDSGKS